MHIGKAAVNTAIFTTADRNFDFKSIGNVELGFSISYNNDKTDIKALGEDCYEESEESEDSILVDNFYDKLHDLFKKDETTRDKEDDFLMKALSDYLPLAVANTIEKNELEIENLDLFHYALIVPSEWEEEMREDIIRPIFVQSGLISNEDHQDRLLFFSDIESIYYELKDENDQPYSFERGQNTILCRLSPDEEKIVVKFDLIETTNTLFNFPNAKFFPKVMKSSSVSVTADDVEGRIKEFLGTNLFPMATDDGGVKKSLKSKLIPSYQGQIIKDQLESEDEESEDEESEDEESEEEESEDGRISVTCQKRWKLSEVQKKFIQSLCPSILCTVIGVNPFSNTKGIISSNSSKSYEFFLLMDQYFDSDDKSTNGVVLLAIILECYRLSLILIDKFTRVLPEDRYIKPHRLLQGASISVFEAIKHSDIYCKPRIVSAEDLNTSSSVFLSSKPDAIVNLDISLGSTLFTYSLLNEDGSIQHIFNHDDFMADNLPPLGHFYTFSNMTTLNVKERFIAFAERYLLGGLTDFTVDVDVFTKKGLLFEVKAILIEKLSNGEVLVSTNKPKYINAFILMYMIYIKEEILYKLPDHLISDQSDAKIGYAVSIEAMLLNDTIGTKDNLRDIIYASGLVPKDNDSKKLRITTQGERILPAIQKSLKLEFPLKSYFLLCQLHEDYVQLSLHQVVTASTSEEKEQESIIVQDEIAAIPNIYDSLCASMWCNLVQDSSLIKLCEMHNTSDKSKIFGLFSSNIKAEFFANLKVHISDNVRVVLQNNPGAQITMDTYAVKLNNSCNCKVRLTTADIIDVSFTPVLQDIACTLSASLLNKELFGNYINIDYLFSFIHFNNNPQLQYAFAKILEEEADDFNLELGIDTCCLLVPQLFSQLIRPIIAQQPLFYKDFKIGALQQVCNENYAFSIRPETLIFETMNYLENNEMFDCDNIRQCFASEMMSFGEIFLNRDIDVPVMISVSYIPYTSSLRFSIKIVGVDTEDEGTEENRNTHQHYKVLLLDLVIKREMNAIELNIKPRIAQIWVKKDQDDRQPYFERKEGSSISVGRLPKLGDEYEKFLVELVDEQPSLVLDQIMDSLTNQFADISISKTGLYKFVTYKCRITLKRAHFHSVDRNSTDKI
ncbi:hypothetical protein MFLAVUS_006382 [Mucor flavus]|uniref:Uncharacterized protein n=1 Tax=Mucor flavus TaxID=439312 RepID=A0ABP9Z1D9_9FUNG